ncbi:DUF473 domain-containing protein [Methanocorpusculum vombati]|uniref:DUF473 domain-containing protein n=1 Tax=Methanocorpusculum vombati TaxID=3002864 RepID=A0ABT4IMD9_9EURY|nr:DUF473 domain-containing protein [Methanocorpusculum vombati]MCZ9319644.1 DUF473 domain-containing protein [Methanocorpusculum sp.]MCZ0862911.1 DUF473 domain-containing protein [Methanocorpusculum vombati]MDE2520888.1 DUF473 domain-containing protein [Methanocorpusculum sp.]MDE2533669.1 DUF473 domain-containing protein [Methanocorpusculum sp.]MDE2546035.1 DUF473 domain-containing protein [Methanocorpusculum sp.]
MQMVGIAGIAPEVIAELKKGRARTIEFVNAQNVISAAAVSVGDPVFVSTVPHEDLSSGDAGIIATVTAASVTMQRMSSAVPGIYYEERERLLVRLQMKFACTSHIRKVVERGYCRVLTVEVAECSCPRAR